MRILNVTLIRLIQLIACLFFTGVVLVYASGLLLLPLALLKAIIGILGNGIFGTIIAIPAVIWLGLRVHAIPGLTQNLLDTGMALVRMGADNFRAFDAIAKSTSGGSTAVSAESPAAR